MECHEYACICMYAESPQSTLYSFYKKDFYMYMYACVELAWIIPMKCHCISKMVLFTKLHVDTCLFNVGQCYYIKCIL